MSRLAPLLTAALLATGCNRSEEVVVAAPVTPPPSPAVHGSPAPAGATPAEGAALPPGHPSLEGMAADAPAPGPQAGALDVASAPAHGAAMSAGGDGGDVKVARATGPDARTVAEVFLQRSALKDRTVTVRGKVVKYTPGVMGKNWLHLRDGTGAPGTDDVTVTTQDAATRGEVITVRGRVALDQDIGMGAPYPVIIQDAGVSR